MNKLWVVALYLAIALFILTKTLSNIPINEATLPLLAIITLALLAGLILVLLWHILIAYLPWYRLGAAKVVKGRFILKRRGTAGYVGYAALKVVPARSVAKMNEKERVALLSSLAGLLSGTEYEAAIAYVSVKDVYHTNVINELQKKLDRIMTGTVFKGRGQEALAKRLVEEIEFLSRLPHLTRGFYYVIVRAYGSNEDDVIAKLNHAVENVKLRFQGTGMEVVELRGEQLRDVAEMVLFGHIVELVL